MKLFDDRESTTRFRAEVISAAYKHADAGGQALHVWDPGPNGWPGAPACFMRTRPWGHLIDADEERLTKTAKKFGVRVVVIGRPGRRGQHVDLCGKPLEKAIASCGELP